MTEQALVTKSSSAIAAWGKRDEVREMDARLAVALPNGSKLSGAERKALAQISVAHGLDPFIGEIWYIPGQGPQVGIKGLRRKAREALHAERPASNYWGNHIEITDPDLRARWQIPHGALAFEYRLFDTITTEFYIKTIKELKDAGMPWDIIVQVVGDKPYTSGIGYWSPSDRTKMTPVQCAQKRAESDALKKRFDINLPLADDDTEGGAYAGEWKDATPTPAEREQELNPVHAQSDASADDVIEGESKPSEQIADEQHERNANALGRDGDGTESLIEQRPLAKAEPEKQPASDPKARLIKHRDEAIAMVDRLSQADQETEAHKLDAMIRAANTALGRDTSATALHSHANTLKKAVADYTKMLAQPELSK